MGHGWLGNARAQEARRPSQVATDKPTARQREALALVEAGNTIREMMAAMGITAMHSVICHIEALIRKGYVHVAKSAGRPGRYQVTDAGLRELGLRRCTCCEGRGTVRA